MKKLRKGDEVIVISGSDKGKRGVITRRVDDEHLLVEGINLARKHVKPNPMKGEQGGIVQKAQPIHQSNVAIVNKASGKADRVGIKVTQGEGGKVKRVRVYKSTGEEIQAA